MSELNEMTMVELSRAHAYMSAVVQREVRLDDIVEQIEEYSEDAKEAAESFSFAIEQIDEKLEEIRKWLVYVED